MEKFTQKVVTNTKQEDKYKDRIENIEKRLSVFAYKKQVDDLQQYIESKASQGSLEEIRLQVHKKLTKMLLIIYLKESCKSTPQQIIMPI